MSSLSNLQDEGVHSDPARGFGRLWSLPAAVTLGGLLALLLTLSKAVAVWRTGIFFDPDDAMRAVEVRDFLAGQGWFDLVPHRLSPHHPFSMHWSRLADLPLAASMLLLGQVTDPDTAERITRLAEPALFYLVFLVTLARLARDLIGRGAPFAVALLAAGSLEAVGNFVPGHIHHHALQLMLLVLMTKLFCDGLDPARSGRMVWAGLSAALSLAINLQNMPFVIAAATILGLLWVWHGAPLDRALAGFGVGLVAGATVAFFLQVPPNRYFEGTCDAFAAPHLLAAGAGSVAFLACARLSSRLRRRAGRLFVLVASGLLVLFFVGLTYPACLGDPYAGVDPLLRERWMSEVGEAMPLARLAARDPLGTIPIAIALSLGLLATLLAALCERGLTQARWIAVAGLTLVGVAGALWQIRVAASAETLTVLGAAWALHQAFGPERQPRRYATLLCFLSGLALTQAGWTAVLALPRSHGTPLAPVAGSLPPIDPDTCFAPASYDRLHSLPTGLVLSTIDPGAHILAYTAHSALAAPYHRDSYGIRVALLAFEAAPEDARKLIAESRARYVALCTASPEVHEILAKAPNGLAAQILAGRLPPWLEAVPSDASPMRVFEVVADLRR